MAEDGQSGAVSADPAVVLDHQGAVDGVGDFAVAVVAALDDQRDAITVGDLVHPGP